jgi:hypothetical protein
VKAVNAKTGSDEKIEPLTGMTMVNKHTIIIEYAIGTTQLTKLLVKDVFGENHSAV